ncbi:MAG: hypothetical protein ACFFEA_14630, partial [Candidatus Thorarchaeota archaeon]
CEDAEQALKKWGLEKPSPDEWGAFLKFLKEFCPCLELTCQPAGEQVVRYLQNVAHVRIYAGLKFDIDPKE